MNFKSISHYCEICKGKCWDPKSQKNTQENAKKEFGIVPNNCVNGSGGTIHCPAALGLIR